MNYELRKLLLMATMFVSFVSCTQRKNAFVNDQRHQSNLSNLHKLNAQMRKQLAQYGTSENSALNLNIYFATNDSINAQHLADTLEKIGYRANHIHRSTKDKTLWVLAATSGRVSMDSVALDN